ncbi:hypothetical protein ACLMJK_006101 [Lecanora helva]
MANEDGQPLWLLLLPTLPFEISLGTLKVAYGPSLSQALKYASNRSTVSQNVVLDIAVCYDGDMHEYPALQHFFGIMYRLICVICMEHRIDLQYGNDVDARIVLARRSAGQMEPPNRSLNCSLEQLAKTDRAWQRVLAPEGEDAEGLLQEFLRVRNANLQSRIASAEIDRLSGGLVVHQDKPPHPRSNTAVMVRHRSVAVGGTFDHLHAGHKLLLTMAALMLDADPVQSRETVLTVGITGDELLQNKKYRDQLEDFYKRQSAIQQFLLGILELISARNKLDYARNSEGSARFGREVTNSLKSGLTIRYVEIFDPCGPTITDEAISALVLSAETRGGGQIVNSRREEKGWSPLDIFEVDVLDVGEDESSTDDNAFQNKISSTDIRRRMQEKLGTADPKS